MVANERFPWVAVSAVIAVAVLSAVAWLGVDDGARSSAPLAPQPALGLTRMDGGAAAAVLAEKLAAYDPTPLFLPSMMNAELSLPPAIHDDVAGPFAPLPPSFAKTGPQRFPAQVAVPPTPVGGLRLTERAEAPLVLARQDSAGGALGGRLGRVEAVEVATGRIAFVADLPISSDQPGDDWQPLELMGAVSRSGVAGKLVVTQSSGSDRVDEFFQGHLMTQVRIGEQLREGIYLLRVGP